MGHRGTAGRPCRRRLRGHYRSSGELEPGIGACVVPVASAEGDTVFVPISDYFGGPRWPGEAKPGLYALDGSSGQLRWSQPAPDVCAGREFCSPGISGAIASIPGAVFAGSMDGWLRAHDSASGEVIWSFDTAREFQALGGVPARGGSLGGGAAPVFKDGMMYVMSGYGIYGHMPGNVLLAFAIE